MNWFCPGPCLSFGSCTYAGHGRVELFTVDRVFALHSRGVIFRRTAFECYKIKSFSLLYRSLSQAVSLFRALCVCRTQLLFCYVYSYTLPARRVIQAEIEIFSRREYRDIIVDSLNYFILQSQFVQEN
jgi:hypothetical protein